MAKRIDLLSAREVQAAGDGTHNDGGGLFLQVAGERASWVLRYTAPGGKRREMGLGGCLRHTLAAAGESLTTARAQRTKARAALLDGRDPVGERQARREAERSVDAVERVSDARLRATLARMARDYHQRVIEPSRVPKVAAQWIASLERNVPPAMWHRPVCNVTAPDVLDLFLELHKRIPETARRVRQRLELVFGDALFRGMCDTNPAASIRSQLDRKAMKRERGEFRSMDYRHVPAFVERLRVQPGTAARALEFGIYTAARTGEILGATWAEFDLKAGVWTVPAARMKAGEEHQVHLSRRALAIVKQMQELGEPFVFPSPMLEERPLSNMGMLKLLARMGVSSETTVHGLCRKTFSTWANETGAARPDVIEACLAHREQDMIRRAYNKAEFRNERRALLEAWAEFLHDEAIEDEQLMAA
jgi:integrase